MNTIAKEKQSLCEEWIEKKIGLIRNENNGSAFIANSMEIKQQQKKRKRMKRTERKREKWWKSASFLRIRIYIHMHT